MTHKPQNKNEDGTQYLGPRGIECKYQDVECDIRNVFGGCELPQHPMEVCPGEEEDDDEN
jgi:hypothetical protein